MSGSGARGVRVSKEANYSLARLPWMASPFFQLLVALALFACGSPALVTNVGPEVAMVSPNGDGLDDQMDLSYSLSRAAQVTIALEDASGRRYLLRDGEPRSQGDYSYRFTGCYAPDPASDTRRVLPKGQYAFVVVAEREGGQREEARTALTIQDVSATPPLFQDVALSLASISPNGDALEDETNLSYGLSKQALVSISVTDEEGHRFPLLRQEPQTAALHSFRWDGTSAGQLLPDGPYTLHLVAEDGTCNRTEHRERVLLRGSGTPRLEVLEARFWPKSLPRGGTLNVEMRIRNTGETLIRTLGPPPGTPYSTDYNFMFFKGEDGQPLYFERPGVWRIGVAWDQADRPFPARWGLGKDLAPGEEVTVTGTVTVNIDRVQQVRFWVGVEQGGVGFPGGQVGQTTITVSY